MENKTFKRTTVTSALPYANGGVHIGGELDISPIHLLWALPLFWPM